jgi:hypothetical protein
MNFILKEIIKIVSGNPKTIGQFHQKYTKLTLNDSPPTHNEPPINMVHCNILLHSQVQASTWMGTSKHTTYLSK